ncbi:MAG: ammonium transporter, partial [Robiginitalea sp.]
GADLMTPNEAVMIGLISGAIIVGGVALIDRLRLDDPVGAVTVHLICGIWGTLAVGLFGSKAGADQLLYQLAGVGAAGIFCMLSALTIIFTLKKTIGIRVDRQEELEGLDLHEHGMDSYADFRMNQH